MSFSSAASYYKHLAEFYFNNDCINSNSEIVASPSLLPAHKNKTEEQILYEILLEKRKTIKRPNESVRLPSKNDRDITGSDRLAASYSNKRDILNEGYRDYQAKNSRELGVDSGIRRLDSGPNDPTPLRSPIKNNSLLNSGQRINDVGNARQFDANPKPGFNDREMAPPYKQDLKSKTSSLIDRLNSKKQEKDSSPPYGNIDRSSGSNDNSEYMRLKRGLEDKKALKIGEDSDAASQRSMGQPYYFNDSKNAEKDSASQQERRNILNKFEEEQSDGKLKKIFEHGRDYRNAEEGTPLGEKSKGEQFDFSQLRMEQSRIMRLSQIEEERLKEEKEKEKKKLEEEREEEKRRKKLEEDRRRVEEERRKAEEEKKRIEQEKERIRRMEEEINRIKNASSNLDRVGTNNVYRPGAPQNVDRRDSDRLNPESKYPRGNYSQFDQKEDVGQLYSQQYLREKNYMDGRGDNNISDKNYKIDSMRQPQIGINSRQNIEERGSNLRNDIVNNRQDGQYNNQGDVQRNGPINKGLQEERRPVSDQAVRGEASIPEVNNQKELKNEGKSNDSKNFEEILIKILANQERLEKQNKEIMETLKRHEEVLKRLESSLG